MDNAIQELQNADNGGVLVWFQEVLWRPKPKPASEYVYHEYLPSIPDTVLLNFSRIQCWYFTPRDRHPPKAATKPTTPGGQQSSVVKSALAHLEEVLHNDAGDDANTTPRLVTSPLSPATGGGETPPPSQHHHTGTSPDKAKTASGRVMKKSPQLLTGRSILQSFTDGLLGNADAAADNGGQGKSPRPSSEQNSTAGSGFGGGGRRNFAAAQRIVAMLVCRSASAPSAAATASSTASSPTHSGAAKRSNSVTSSVTTSAPDRLREFAGATQPRVEYLNPSGLRQFLYHSSLGETAILVNFINSAKGGASDGAGILEQVHETLEVNWQWSSVVVTRHRAVYDFKQEFSKAVAAAVSDALPKPTEVGIGSPNVFGPTHSTMVGTASVAEPLKRACNAIAEHVSAVCELQVVRMTAIFKLDGKGAPRLLYVQAVHCAPANRLFRAPRVACPEALVTTLLFSGAHPTWAEFTEGAKGDGNSFASSANASSPKAAAAQRARAISPEKIRLAQGLQARREARTTADSMDATAHGWSALSRREATADEKYWRLIPEAWRHALQRREVSVQRMHAAQAKLAALGARRSRSPPQPASMEVAMDQSVGPKDHHHHTVVVKGGGGGADRPTSAGSKATPLGSRPGSAMPPSRGKRPTSAITFAVGDDPHGGGFESFEGSFNAPSASHSPVNAPLHLPSPASAELTVHGAEPSGPLTPRSRRAATRRTMRKLDARLGNGVVAVSVTDETWSSSRVDSALLRKTVSTNLFEKSNFAADAGRMGIADMYIGNMKAYNGSKPILDSKTKQALENYEKRRRQRGA